jgi:hypothetical protein
MPTKLNSDYLLQAANVFYKRAQGFGTTTTADPMKKALDAAIGGSVKKMVTDAFQKSVSDVQVNIEFDPTSKTAKFTVYANGTPEDQAALTGNLNTLAQKAYPIVAKFQKNPMDYKYVSYAR